MIMRHENAIGLGLAAMTAVVLLPGIAAAQRRNTQDSKVALWAAMAVNQPVFPKSRTDNLTLTFAVVNDGDSTVNPGIAKSHLFINGVELKQWEFINTNGPKTTFHTALPPKRTVSFSCGCGQYFSKPGVYTVRWLGASFKALDITFRVLPGDL